MIQCGARSGGNLDQRKVGDVIRTGVFILEVRFVDSELVIIQWQKGEPIPVYPPALAVNTAEWE